MKRPRNKPLKLVTLDDLIEQDSIRHQMAASVDFITGETWADERQDRLEGLLKAMYDLGEQAKALIAAVPRFAQKNTLHANVNMLRLRDEIRKLVPEAIACFKCYRLFVPASPGYRGCQDCYSAYLATKPPRDWSPDDYEIENGEWHEDGDADSQGDRGMDVSGNVPEASHNGAGTPASAPCLK